MSNQYQRRMKTRYTEENDGNTRRQQIRTHIGRALASFCVMCISLAALVRLTRIDPAEELSYDGTTDYRRTTTTTTAMMMMSGDDGDDDRRRRRRERLIVQRYQNKPRDTSSNDEDNSYVYESIPTPQSDQEKLDLILSGKVHMIGLTTQNANLHNPSGYEGVLGEFCSVDWSKYKNDPPSTPMFKDLTKTSCNKHNTFTYDLKQIVTIATTTTTTTTTAHPNVHTIHPTGFIFHESRCGSTLIANALTAMDPRSHRVYSEARPPIAALKACGTKGKECSPRIAVELFQDVVYVMGRTRDPYETRLFFKIQSLGSRYMDVVTEAFPNTPWIFVYRDPVQVMMSQMRNGVDKANCVTQLDDADLEHEERRGNLGLDGTEEEEELKLGQEEKCAFHLSTLCNAAITALKQSNGIGIAVNYNNLLHKLIESVFPNHFKLTITMDRRERIINVGGSYSKGRVKNARKWEDDSEEKEMKATSVVRTASKKFLSESYATLENLAGYGSNEL